MSFLVCYSFLLYKLEFDSEPLVAVDPPGAIVPASNDHCRPAFTERPSPRLLECNKVHVYFSPLFHPWKRKTLMFAFIRAVRLFSLSASGHRQCIVASCDQGYEMPTPAAIYCTYSNI